MIMDLQEILEILAQFGNAGDVELYLNLP